jgi:hypothetical protein
VFEVSRRSASLRAGEQVPWEEHLVISQNSRKEGTDGRNSPRRIRESP